MKKYKIAIIGLGSIGRRHLVNISRVLSERKDSYTIDVIRSGIHGNTDESLSDLINNVYYSYEEVPQDYDVIIISNPTAAHYETIKRYIPNTMHMFIEKPVFNSSDLSLNNMGLKSDGIYYVACPLRYSGVIQYIKNKVDLCNLYCVRVMSSSYLPDWRPKIDYRTTYSASNSQGGGVSLDLIHEWDYICYLFGEPKRVFNIAGKFSDLEIDSDDISVYIAEYEKFLVEVHLDYIGRKPIREVQLFTRDDTIQIDILNASIHYLKSGNVISFSETRDDVHLREIIHFFDIIEGREQNSNDIKTAMATIKIALKNFQRRV